MSVLFSGQHCRTIVRVHDVSTYSVFIDGKLLGSVDARFDFPDNGQVAVGEDAHIDSRLLRGTVYALQVWDVALSKTKCAWLRLLWLLVFLTKLAGRFAAEEEEDKWVSRHNSAVHGADSRCNSRGMMRLRSTRPGFAEAGKDLRGKEAQQALVSSVMLMEMLSAVREEKGRER